MNEYKSFSQTKNLAHIELLSRPQLGDLEEIPGVRLPWSTGPDVGDFTPYIPVNLQGERPDIDGKSQFLMDTLGTLWLFNIDIGNGP